MVLKRIGMFLAGLGVCLTAVAQESVELLKPTQVMADSSQQFLNSGIVNQWVVLDANGEFGGKLYVLDDLGVPQPRPAVEVSLITYGKTNARAITEADGSFRFKGVAPGTYSFEAQGEFTFAAIGFHVLPNGGGTPAPLEVCATQFSKAKAQALVNEHWVPSDVPPQYPLFKLDPLGASRKVSSSAKVLLENGDLVGRVSKAGLPYSLQDLSGNIAYVYQAGRTVASAPISRDGRFVIKSLPAGVYDFVVIGQGGAAFLGFEAVGAKPLADAKRPFPTLVAFQDTAGSLNAELAPTSDSNGSSPEDVPPPPIVPDFGAPIAGGGFAGAGGGGASGGGMGGGGAGAGGGGGLGGLLGLAGLAAGVAAASNNDNFNPGQATIVGP